MTNEEKNRRVSELIEPSASLGECFGGESKAWTTEMVGHIPFQVRGTPIWIPKKWDTDESASAMLLEMIPDVALYRDGAGWSCYWYSDPSVEVSHADRKTAIRDAFLRWKRQANETNIAAN